MADSTTNGNSAFQVARSGDRAARRSDVPGGGEAGTRPLVVFALDDSRYALALPSVRRVLRVVAVTPLPEAPPIVLGVVDLGGTIVPVVDLRRRFGHPSRGVRLSDQLVVAHTGRRTVALLVDEARGVLEVPGDELVPARHILPGLELVDGAVKLPDGLVLIHDLERLLSLEEEAAIDHALLAAGAPDPAAPDGGHGSGVR